MKPIQELEHVVIKEEAIDTQYVDKNSDPFPVQCQGQQMATVKLELDVASVTTQPVYEVKIKEEVEVGPTEFLPQYHTPGKTSRSGKPIKSQARQIVFNVYLYFLNEANIFGKENNGYFKKIQKRVTDATGISRRTLTNILNEKDKAQAPFSTPKKGRPKKKYRMGLHDFDYCVIRNMIYNFHFKLKELPTLTNLRHKLIKDIDFKGCKETLRNILKEIGFHFVKTQNKKQVLVEKDNVRLKRIEYLKEIQQLRTEGKNIVFMDESYVNTSHTKGKSWQDSKNKGMKPVKKGERFIIVHAGNEKGFVSGALMLHKCVENEVDLHKEINAERYQDWLRNQLIPNLPPNSILVIDNAPHHNKLCMRAPNANTLKPQMIEWLQQHNIPHDPMKMKPELYAIIKTHKEKYSEFTIDLIMEQHGHRVVRLPPYHPDFNPIENMWAEIKQYVARENDTTVKENILEKINTIGIEKWKKVCDQSIKCEDEYRKLEPKIDGFVDSMIIASNDTSGESDNERDELSDASMMSGVEMTDSSDSE